MRGDSGQASIEWIGAALLLALALGAVGRFAGGVDPEPVAGALLSTTTCAVHHSCERHAASPPTARRLERSVTVPPLVPAVPTEWRRRPHAIRIRRPLGVLWRRAWVLCFGYERARFGLLHPETGPRQTVPVVGRAPDAERLRQPDRLPARLGAPAPAMTAPHAQRGQAAVEFIALVLVACVALGALVSLGSGADGRAAGGFFAHHIACAIGGRCHDDERELVRAYGERDAATIRSLAPHLVYEPGERQLPVDWRQCRHPGCAAAPDDPSLDVHTTDSGRRATAFTRLIRRDGRLYVGYWLYFPDSNTALAGSDRLWERSWLLPRMRDLRLGHARLPRLSPRRLGGRLRPARPRRVGLDTRELARPLQRLRLERLPRVVAAGSGVGAHLARQPFGARAGPHRDPEAPHGATAPALRPAPRPGGPRQAPRPARPRPRPH